jgi:hypothetical protein
MLPKLDRRRALFVLSKIDQILAWERGVENQRDTKFVELGRYLCEVRAGQYWRLENLKSFDEFLERRFPESRRKAYYLMSIHEHSCSPRSTRSWPGSVRWKPSEKSGLKVKWWEWLLLMVALEALVPSKKGRRSEWLVLAGILSRFL